MKRNLTVINKGHGQHWDDFYDGLNTGSSSSNYNNNIIVILLGDHIVFNALIMNSIVEDNDKFIQGLVLYSIYLRKAFNFEIHNQIGNEGKNWLPIILLW